MSDQKVIVLNQAEAVSLGRDAKIVALRWDLVPWCLTSDLDTPVSEVIEADICRSWLVFVGINEVSWLVDRARLPNGIFCTNALVATERPDGFHKYELSILAPGFWDSDKLTNNPHDRITIRAKGLLGASSTARAKFGEFGPDRKLRELMANDDDFLQAIGDV